MLEIQANLNLQNSRVRARRMIIYFPYEDYKNAIPKIDKLMFI